MLHYRIIFIFLILGNSLPAQQIIFKNYSMQDGLVANQVRSIYQDANGFIWIATWQGLSKYDGNKFTNFSMANGLSFDLVNDICESGQGKLYVGLNNGTVDMIENDRVTQHINREQFTVNRFFKTKNDEVIASTDDKGLLHVKQGTLSRLSKPFPGALEAYGELNDSMIILCGEHKPSYHIFHVVDRNFNIIATSKDRKNVARRTYRDNHKRLWVCTDKGLLLVSPDQQRNADIKFLSLPSSFNIPALSGVITCMVEDANGNFWIGTINGLVKIHKNGRSQVFTTEMGLPSNIIECIYIDKEENIWVGTDQGISKIVSKNNIQVFTARDGLTGNGVFDMYTADATAIYWVTTKGTIQKMNIANYSVSTIGTVKNISFPVAFIRQNSQPLILSGKSLTAIDTANNKVCLLKTSLQKDAYTVICDSNGNFFMGTDTGIYMQFSATNRMHEIGDVPHRITSMVFDRQGYLWAGTWYSGLYRITLSYNGNTVHCITENMTHLLPDSTVRSLFTDSHGNIWVGTRYSGAIRLSITKKGNFHRLHFSQKQGLISNFISGIVEDRKGNIWFNTYLGLDKLIPTGDGFRVFNFCRVNNFFERMGAIYPEAGNIFWLPTSLGVVQFADDEVDKLPPPKALITRLLPGKPEDGLTVTDLKHPLSLTFRQNLIQFEFSATSFINEKEIVYRHRLLGSPDTGWSNPARQHHVLYAGLRPGKYTFEVKAAGWNGTWSEAATYSFTIHPPWWQTWWAYTLYILVAAGMMYALYRRRIKQLEKKQAEQISIMVATQEDERKRISHDLHDDIGIKLSAIKLYVSSFKDKLQENRLQEAGDIAATSAQLIDEIMTDVRQMLRDLSPAVLEEFGYAVAVEGLVNRINDTKRTHFNLVVFGLEKKLPAAYELALYRITQELINNVLKHAEATQVSLQIGYRDEKVILMIEDNGKGFDMHAHKVGFGLNNLAARTQLMQGIIEIDSQPGRGTSVLIEIPNKI